MLCIVLYGRVCKVIDIFAKNHKDINRLRYQELKLKRHMSKTVKTFYLFISALRVEQLK